MPRDQWYRKYKIYRFNKVWNLHYDLDLKTTIPLVHKTLQPMMMYHSIKLGFKKISSSIDMVDTVIFDYMNPHCGLDLEDSKPIFLHDTLAHDDASPYQFGSKRFSDSENIIWTNMH